MLPDGNVLVTGGGTDKSAFISTNGVLAAEMWSPSTGTWTTLASAATSAALPLDRAPSARRPRARRRRRRRLRRPGSGQRRDLLAAVPLQGCAADDLQHPVDADLRLELHSRHAGRRRHRLGRAGLARFGDPRVQHEPAVHEPDVPGHAERPERRRAGERRTSRRPGTTCCSSSTATACRRSPTFVSFPVGAVPSTVAVPNVVNSTQAAATAAITNAGLVVGAITHGVERDRALGLGDQPEPCGRRRRSRPAPRCRWSCRAGRRQVTVPNVVNTPQASASAAITGARPHGRRDDHGVERHGPGGFVISQNPAAGTQVASGSAVALVALERLGPRRSRCRTSSTRHRRRRRAQSPVSASPSARSRRRRAPLCPPAPSSARTRPPERRWPEARRFRWLSRPARR